MYIVYLWCQNDPIPHRTAQAATTLDYTSPSDELLSRLFHQARASQGQVYSCLAQNLQQQQPRLKCPLTTTEDDPLRALEPPELLRLLSPPVAPACVYLALAKQHLDHLGGSWTDADATESRRSRFPAVTNLAVAAQCIGLGAVVLAPSYCYCCLSSPAGAAEGVSCCPFPCRVAYSSAVGNVAGPLAFRARQNSIE